MTPIKVLLVDDDEDDYILTRDIFKEIPQKENYQLSWVNNYEEGINAMLKNHYDVYLIDYRLGKYTGIDLLHEAIKSNVAEPIIILTGKGDHKVDSEALEIGAADYLIKDKIDPYTIERSIRYALKHKKTMYALQESEKKFRIIFEKSKDPIMIIDANGTFLDMNNRGLKFLNYHKSELDAIKSEDIFFKQSDATRFNLQMDENGSVSDFETQLKSKSGLAIPVSISAFLQIDQHALQETYYCIIHDLTGRKKEEQANVDAEKIAITERIAKSLAQEIRNPLSNINLSLEQLDANSFDEIETSQLYLNIIKTNFERINILISDFISSTQSSSLEILPHSLNPIIDECYERISAETKYKHIMITKNLSSEDLFIDADEEKIKASIYNIIYNALQSISAENGFVKISTYEKDSFAILQIEDNGIGIKPEDQKNIFEPFFSTKLKGFGLGLTNVMKIIKEHKGKIEFESQENSGSIFKIYLPKSRQIQLWNTYN